VRRASAFAFALAFVAIFGGDTAGAASATDIAALPPPAPVVDQAKVIDAQTRQRLTSLSLEVKQRTSAELAVLTVATTKPLDEFTYGMQVLKTWSLGSAKEDYGLLFLVAVEDHRARFFTGYGLEGILPDGRLGAILDRYVIPRIRQGDIAGGIEAGMNEVARIVVTEIGDGRAPPKQRGGPGGGLSVAALLLIVLVWGVLAVAMMGARRRYPPTFWGGGFGGPMGGGFGGGFGGGGFGGGGGGFGGGGAGRGW